VTAAPGGQLIINYRIDDVTMIEINCNSLSYYNDMRPGINLINYCIARSVAPNATIKEIVG